MARPSPWLPRIAEIRRSVRESIRSHYNRHDIEKLFQIQRRAAQDLMKAVRVGTKVGTSALVDRQSLADFLAKVAESDEPLLVLQATRSQPKVPDGRRALRDLVQVDGDVATLDTMPRNISASLGKVTFEFNSIREFAGSLLAMAQILNDPDQLEKFVDLYEPIFKEEKDENGTEVEEFLSAFAKMRKDCEDKTNWLKSLPTSSQSNEVKMSTD